MPRYFFHHRIGDRMMWDQVGCELPDIGMAPDPDRAATVWMDMVAGRLQPDRILVITDGIGQVLFVTTR
ncbi:hypothetical protein [Microvirga calopogonii]|uniref:hypothetical protein n=1 Tax=Microvirga calopogonii TaxID=2078013 RepID=UPI000E0CD087|nr:hypothetical protein [Microvirga calopogonii]